MNTERGTKKQDKQHALVVKEIRSTKAAAGRTRTLLKRVDCIEKKLDLIIEHLKIKKTK